MQNPKEIEVLISVFNSALESLNQPQLKENENFEVDEEISRSDFIRFRSTSTEKFSIPIRVEIDSKAIVFTQLEKLRECPTLLYKWVIANKEEAVQCIVDILSSNVKASYGYQTKLDFRSQDGKVLRSYKQKDWIIIPFPLFPKKASFSYKPIIQP